MRIALAVAILNILLAPLAYAISDVWQKLPPNRRLMLGSSEVGALPSQQQAAECVTYEEEVDESSGFKSVYWESKLNGFYGSEECPLVTTLMWEKLANIFGIEKMPENVIRSLKFDTDYFHINLPQKVYDENAGFIRSGSISCTKLNNKKENWIVRYKLEFEKKESLSEINQRMYEWRRFNSKFYSDFDLKLCNTENGA